MREGVGAVMSEGKNTPLTLCQRRSPGRTSQTLGVIYLKESTCIDLLGKNKPQSLSIVMDMHVFVLNARVGVFSGVEVVFNDLMSYRHTMS